MAETLHFDPAEPDGTNATLDLAISSDGTPELGETYNIVARTGRAVLVRRGQNLTVINTHGTQVCDFWAFDAHNTAEHLSMAHCHTALGKVGIASGDVLVSNRRRDMLRLLLDTSPGVHDTVIAACDMPRYQQLGVETYHDNCVDNLRMSFLAIGRRLPVVPAPLNLWMNIPIDSEGRIDWLPTVSSAGDEIRFEALMDCVVVMSACPQDITPINGADVAPTSLDFRVD